MEVSDNDWEARAVLNPSVIYKEGVEHIFYRAVAKNWVSCVGYARIEGNGEKEEGRLVRFDKPIVFPTRKYEKGGIEDPRVTKIGKKYYMLYTAFDGKNARVAYAVSNDLEKWKKMGVISPNINISEARNLVKVKRYKKSWKRQDIKGSDFVLWDKDAVLFPRKIGGKFVMLHRFFPDIQVVRFRSFSELKRDDFWRNYILNLRDGLSLKRKLRWEREHIGVGAVPIETREGWLLVYHGVEIRGKSIFFDFLNRFFFRAGGFLERFRKKRLPFIYRAGAMLLDSENPQIEISRLKRSLFSPRCDWEKEGDINDVVFPEGAFVKGDVLKIYYGCSDSRIGVAEVGLRELMDELKKDRKRRLERVFRKRSV